MTLLDSTEEDALTAAVAAMTERRAVIEQAKGMLILLYGVGDHKPFDMVRARSQRTNIKMRTLAEHLVFDYRALSNEDELKPRSMH